MEPVILCVVVTVLTSFGLIFLIRMPLFSRIFRNSREDVTKFLVLTVKPRLDWQSMYVVRQSFTNNERQNRKVRRYKQVFFFHSNGITIKKPANKKYIKLMNITKYLDLKLFSNQLFNNIKITFKHSRKNLESNKIISIVITLYFHVVVIVVFTSFWKI